MMNGDNKLKCDHCKRETEALRTSQLYKLPKILIIQFKRFREDEKSKKDEAVDFPLHGFDMSKYMVPNALMKIKE